MRILVANWSSRHVGGMETYLGRIMPLLAASGCEIAFGCEVDEPSNRPRLPLPPRAITFRLAGVPDDGLRAVREWRPDVVYVHGLLDPAVEARLLLIAPAVFFAHSYHGTCVSGDKTHKFPIVQPCDRLFGPACLALFFPRRCGGLSPVTMARDYVRQRKRLSLLRRYAAVVTSSEHMRHELARHGAAAGCVVNCAFPVSGADRLPGMPAARQPHLDGAAWHLVFAGRMDRLKGGAHLIDALPRVQHAVQRPVRLSLAGDGPARSAWERRAQDVMRQASGVTIEFAGWLQDAPLTSLVDTCDLLVMPSLWPEPYGLIGPEANRRGVPVVAYATGGIPEWLVEGVNGCLAPADPPTVDGLADAIVRCTALLSSGNTLRDGALEAGSSKPDEAHLSALLKVLSEAAGHGRIEDGPVGAEG